MNNTRIRKGRRFISALLRITGIIFLVIVVFTALPLTIPRILGYEIYNVETGSMEPALPAGSVIYVETETPESIVSGDIITFAGAEETITHRVVSNNIVEGKFTTKGDANEKEDLTPVLYSEYIGKVVFHLPVLGMLLVVYATAIGKVYVLLFAACGVMMNILGSMIK